MNIIGKMSEDMKKYFQGRKTIFVQGILYDPDTKTAKAYHMHNCIIYQVLIKDVSSEEHAKAIVTPKIEEIIDGVIFCVPNYEYVKQ